METTKAYVGKQRLQRMLQAVGHAEIVRIYQVSYQALSSRLETLKAQSKQRQSQRLRASARPSSGDGFRIPRSLSRSLSPSLAFSLSRSLAPSLPRSLAPSCVHAFYLSRTLCLSRSLSLSLSLSLDRTFACSLCGPLPKPLLFSLFCLLLAFFLSRSLALSLSRSLALRSLSEALAVDGLGAKASGAYIQTRARIHTHTQTHAAACVQSDALRLMDKYRGRGGPRAARQSTQSGRSIARGAWPRQPSLPASSCPRASALHTHAIAAGEGWRA